MVLLSLFIVLVIGIAIAKERILNFSTFMLASILYAICYGIVPLVIYTVDIPDSYDGPLGNLVYDLEASKHLYYYASVLAFLSYLVFWTTYRVASFKPKVLFGSYLSTRKGSNKLYKISKWFFIIGVVFLVLYIAIYGSITNMLLGNTRMAYGGEAEVQVESPYLFLINLAKIVIFSTYMFWGIKKTVNTKARVYLYFALLVSLFLLFRFSGRMILMTFISTFALSSFILKQQLPKLKVVLLAALAGFIILFGRAIFSSVLYEDAFSRRQERYTGGWITPILDIVGGFSFPFRNIVHTLDLDFINYQYLVDMIQAPLYLLPRRIIPIKPAATTIEINTMNILGVEGEIMPPDIVTYGYLNLGLVGIVVTALLFGLLCKYIDSYQRRGVPAISTIVIVALIFIVGFRVMYFNPKQLVVGSFYFFVGLSILSMLKPRGKYSLFNHNS